jgi:hypothetical protein
MASQYRLSTRRRRNVKSDRFVLTTLALAAAMVLAACTPVMQVMSTEPKRAPAPIEERRTPPATAAAAPALPGTPSASTAFVPPADALYVCVTESNGVRKQEAIEFTPKVHSLCRRHPEMGPCQYERNACRGAGGRVYAAGGREITLATEAEYDRKVLRVRFRSD